LKILVEKHREFNIKTHIAFADFKKACDRINTRKLLEIVANDTIPQWIIKKYI